MERMRGREMEEQEIEKVKRYLEKGRGDGHGGSHDGLIEGLPNIFMEVFIVQGIRLHLIEPGRIICSLKVPPRLLVCHPAYISRSSITEVIPKLVSIRDFLILIEFIPCRCVSFDDFLVQNDDNLLHGGATAMLVDVMGSAVIYSLGALTSGVSVEINVSYVDAPSLDV